MWVRERIGRRGRPRVTDFSVHFTCMSQYIFNRNTRSTANGVQCIFLDIYRWVIRFEMIVRYPELRQVRNGAFSIHTWFLGVVSTMKNFSIYVYVYRLLFLYSSFFQCRKHRGPCNRKRWLYPSISIYTRKFMDARVSTISSSVGHCTCIRMYL